MLMDPLQSFIPFPVCKSLFGECSQSSELKTVSCGRNMVSWDFKNMAMGNAQEILKIIKRKKPMYK